MNNLNPIKNVQYKVVEMVITVRMILSDKKMGVRIFCWRFYPSVLPNEFV